MLVSAILGFVFGFVGSIPVAGPVAALVLARALESRFRSAYFIAIGAALAEGVYTFLAFYGFGELLANRAWIMPVSKAAGAVILVALGAVFLFQKRKIDDDGLEVPPPRSRGLGSFMLGASITAMNPTLIATWTAAATFIYSTDWITYTPQAAMVFAVGAVFGISSWFITMLLLIAKFKGRFTRDTVWSIRRVTGGLVMLLGLWFAVQAVAYFS